MLSDIIGAGYMLLLMTVFDVGRMGDELYLTAPALVISSILIFIAGIILLVSKNNRKNIMDYY